MRRLTLFALAFSLTAQGSLEQRAIALVRRTPVSRLERGLPRQPLEQWLARATGATLKWEVNDCGEQSGDPAIDRGRDFPLCVDAIANLSGDRVAIVTIAVGTFQRGVTHEPELLWVVLGTPARFDRVPKLRALQSELR